MTINKKNLYKIEVTENISQRLDKYLSEKFDQYSRSGITNLIKKEAVTVNNHREKASYKVQENDIIQVMIPEPENDTIIPENIPLDILFEDDHYIAINKLAGIVVHPGAGNTSGTLVNALMYYTKTLSLAGGDTRPGIVHRLDKDTSGVMICAKNDEAHWKLGKLFSSRKIYKEYRTIVWGTPKQNTGIIDTPIIRSKRERKKYIVHKDGKNAVSKYEIIQEWSKMSLIKIILETGRTHQIRVHMKHINCPVVGDSSYGSDTGRLKGLNLKQLTVSKAVLSNIERQLLHSYKIAFTHPMNNNELEIIAPIPEDFQKVQKILNYEENLK